MFHLRFHVSLETAERAAVLNDVCAAMGPLAPPPPPNHMRPFSGGVLLGEFFIFLYLSVTRLETFFF